MSVLGDLATASVSKVVVRSNLGTFTKENPLAAGDPNAPPPLFMRLLDPVLEVYDADGALVLSKQFAGEPSAFPWLAVVLVVGLVGSLAAVVAIARAV